MVTHDSSDPGGATPRDGEVSSAEVLFALPADSGAPSIARRCLVERAIDIPQGLIDDALLLVSELVANAVEHGQPDIVLRIRSRPPRIGVSVQDGGRGRLTYPTGLADPGATRGRGLRIVDALSASWGVEAADPLPGKVVWFELEPEA